MHYERTGQGQHIETSLLESSLYAQSYVAASQLIGDTEYTRKGNEHPLISPYTVPLTATPSPYQFLYLTFSSYMVSTTVSVPLPRTFRRTCVAPMGTV